MGADVTAPAYDPLTAVTVARYNGETWAVVACGCAIRLNVSMERTGQIIADLLVHAADIARGERGGCLPNQPGTRLNPGRPR